MYRGNNLACIYTNVHLDQLGVIYNAGIGYFYRNKLIRIATITISVFHFRNKLIQIATIAILAERQRSGDKLISIMYIERIITNSIDTQWYVHKETANSNKHNATMQSEVQRIATNKNELHYIEFTKINEPQRNTVNHNVLHDYCHEFLFLRLAPRILSVSPWLSS